MRTRLSAREARAGVRRRAPSCPHPPARTFWQEGDYATPDKLVCGRCFVVLAQRTHAPPPRR
jgi:hypothetical protein